MAGAEKRFFAAHPLRDLAFELRDERLRAGATRGSDELVAYLAYWHKRLVKAQRAYPARWGVRGMSLNDLREALETDLIEAVHPPSWRSSWRSSEPAGI